MDIVQHLQNSRLDVQWELEIVPVRMRKRKWLAMMRDHYPPQLEIMSHTEVLGGLRELSEGVLKYEGDQVRKVVVVVVVVTAIIIVSLLLSSLSSLSLLLLNLSSVRV